MSYQSRGAARKDLVAGLAYSIAYNYLNRLVRERKIGDCIFFQGGTAYNDAVAAAFAQILRQGRSSCRRTTASWAPSAWRCWRASAWGAPARSRPSAAGTSRPVDYTVKDFVCKHCSNECDIRQFTIEGEKTYWGDKCSDRYRKRAKVDKEPVIADLVALRERAAAGALRSGGAAQRPTPPSPWASRAPCTPSTACPSGPPSSPTWAARPMLSRETDKGIRENGVDMTVAEPCFPIRVAHGHVEALFAEGADYVFVPNVLNEETEFPEVNSHACPWGQTLPFVIRTAPRLERYRDRLLDAARALPARRSQLVRDLRPLAEPLGAEPSALHDAVAAANAAQQTLPRAPRGRRAQGPGRPRGVGRARHRRHRTPVQHVRQGREHGHPAQAAHVLRRQRDPHGLPRRSRASTCGDVVPNMYWNYGRKILQAGKFVGTPRAPAHHLPDQLQVRSRLVHQALRAAPPRASPSSRCSSTSTRTTPAP